MEQNVEQSNQKKRWQFWRKDWIRSIAYVAVLFVIAQWLLPYAVAKGFWEHYTLDELQKISNYQRTGDTIISIFYMFVGGLVAFYMFFLSQVIRVGVKLLHVAYDAWSTAKNK